MESVLEYQWIKVLNNDEDCCFPQFDPLTGVQNKWFDEVLIDCPECGKYDDIAFHNGMFFGFNTRYDGVCRLCGNTGLVEPQVTKMILAPLTEDIAGKLVARGIAAISTDLIPFIVNVKPTDSLKCYWDNAEIQSSHYECEACGYAWQHKKADKDIPLYPVDDCDSSQFVVCPKCGITDVWYCRRCKVDIPDNIKAELKKREDDYSRYLMSLAADLKSKVPEEIKNDDDKKRLGAAMAEMIEKQVAARESIDKWAMSVHAYKIVNQDRIHRVKAGETFNLRGEEINLKTGEINCPDCDVPQGLVRKERLHFVDDTIELVDYVIEVGGKAKITVRNHEVQLDFT